MLGLVTSLVFAAVFAASARKHRASPWKWGLFAFFVYNIFFYTGLLGMKIAATVFASAPVSRESLIYINVAATGLIFGLSICFMLTQLKKLKRKAASSGDARGGPPAGETGEKAPEPSSD